MRYFVDYCWSFRPLSVRYFVDCCWSFRPFSSHRCIICPSSINNFRLPLRHLLKLSLENAFNMEYFTQWSILYEVTLHLFCRSVFVPFLLAIVLPVPLRFTDSDYPFDISKLVIVNIKMTVLVILVELLLKCLRIP